MRIEEIMSKPVVTCRTSDPLSIAAQLMWDCDCGVVPVTSDDGTLVGMLTDRDICFAAHTQGKTLAEIPASTAMSREVYSCYGDESIEVAERVMGERQIRRVPVIDSQSRPIGLVSLSDITRATAQLRKKNGAERDVVNTLAAISQPRSEQAWTRATSTAH